jgi:hypothetical protein
MPATNIKSLEQGEIQKGAPRLIGTGAIAATDALVTDPEKYPIGTEYYSTSTRVTYRRVAAAKAIGDWAASVAGTLLT